jgi:uncharacterized protein (TIRG00374 family)
LPYLGALAIVGLLLWQIDPATIWHLLVGADWRWLLVGLAAYIATNVLRAFRFWVLLGDRLQGIAHGPATASATPSNLQGKARFTLAPLRILPEMFTLSLFNNILPSRTGELSFPYFMRDRHGVAVGDSTAALLLVRIFDYLAVASLYVLFALAEASKLDVWVKPILMAVALFLVLSLIVLAAMPWLGRWGLQAATWLMGFLGLRDLRLSQIMLRVGRQLVQALEQMRTPRKIISTFGWSILTWLATFAWFGAFLRALGLAQPFPLVVVGATFAMLAKALPFLTVGGFGAHEAGWTIGFGLVGMTTDVAIASGFAVNILTLLASALCGGTALLIMARDGRGGRGRWPGRGDSEGESEEAKRPAWDPGPISSSEAEVSG